MHYLFYPLFNTLSDVHEFFNWLYVLFGGPSMARLIHRGAAISFVSVSILCLSLTEIVCSIGLKNAFKWGKR